MAYHSNRQNSSTVEDTQQPFYESSSVGSLQIDSKNKLFRIKNARSAVYVKKKGLLRKTGSVALAVGTVGMSTALKATTRAMAKKPDGIYHFNELIEFELLEDNTQLSIGGLGRALVGAVTFGGTGAVVGGITGKRKTKKVINMLSIRITVDDLNNPAIVLPFITTKTKTSSNEYKTAFNLAQRTISTLNVIANGKDEVIQKVEIMNSGSSNEAPDKYDEIKKLKELLDMGIITQEEFDTKRNELLSL